MTRKLTGRLGLFLTIAVFVACSGGVKPQDPLWDREVCAHCRMTISERRYATQLIGPGATVRHYDDLGCALMHRRQNTELQKGRLFVRPFGGENWTPAESASYLDQQRTPMGFGYGPVSKDGRLSLQDVESALLGGAQ